MAVAYAGASALVYLRQASFIYVPDRNVEFTPANAGLFYEEVVLTTQDGARVCGWYVPSTWEATTILSFHGNAGNMGDRIDTLKALHEMGYNVMTIDYRGYGKSTGKPTEQGTYLDAMAAWNHLVVERKADPAKIVVYGRSLGGAIATWLASQKNPCALVIHSSFASMQDMASIRFPFLPVRRMCRFKYDSAARAAGIRCPVLVAHSPEDEVVPYEQGRKLFGAMPEGKDFVALKGRHDDPWLEEDDLASRRRFQLFVASSCGETSAGAPSPGRNASSHPPAGS